MKSDTPNISARVSKTLKEAVEKGAKSRGLSTSSFVAELLADAVSADSKAPVSSFEAGSLKPVTDAIEALAASLRATKTSIHSLESSIASIRVEFKTEALQTKTRHDELDVTLSLVADAFLTAVTQRGSNNLSRQDLNKMLDNIFPHRKEPVRKESA